MQFTQMQNISIFKINLFVKLNGKKMKKQNKFLTKYLLSYYIFAGVFTLLSVAPTAVFAVDKPNKNVYEKSSLDKVICLLLTAICLFMAYINAISIPKKIKRKTYNLTNTYMDNVIKKYPDLQKYKHLLANPEFIKNLTVFICNDLDNQEHEEIFKAIRCYNIEYYENPTTENIKIIDDIDHKILHIVKKHAENKPEFLQNISTMLKNPSKTYVMPMSYRTR